MNKRAMSPAATLGTFILVFLLVFGLIVLYNKVANGSTKILQCNANGGTCTDGTCDFRTQIPVFSDKAAGCAKGQLCCINTTQEIKEDPLCKDHEGGEACGTDGVHFCSIGAKQCVTKCEFCSANPTHTNCNSAEAFRSGYLYKCQCSDIQCEGKYQDKTCVKAAAGTTQYCPSDNANTYRCCNIRPT